jgi:threonine aldolase
MLAGASELIDEARLWRARHAGVLPYNPVLAVAALAGMERHLPKMSEYCARAREIALALRQELGLRTTPDVPQTNGFHAYLPVELAAVDRARREIAEQRSVWLFNKLIPAQMPGHTVVELWIGDAAQQLSTAEIVSLIASVIGA